MSTSVVTPPMRRKAEALAELVPMFTRGRTSQRHRLLSSPSATAVTVAHCAQRSRLHLRRLHRRCGVCTHQLAVATVQQRAEAASIAAAQPAPAKSAQAIYESYGPFGPASRRRARSR